MHVSFSEGFNKSKPCVLIDEGSSINSRLTKSIFVQAVITSYDGVLTLDGVKCQQYFHARGSFYQSLVPVKSVRDMVSELRDNYFLNKIMVGVHYRAFDPVNDWGET